MDTILLIEDDEGMSSYLSTELKLENYKVLLARNGEEGLTEFRKNSGISVILLDWMLPKLDGLEVLRRIRDFDENIAVIFMTAKSEIGDKIAGLDGGADDYLVKPFEIEELLARIRLALRHNKRFDGNQDFYRVADLTLNTKSRQVFRDNKKIQLTQREYDLLLFLIKNKNLVFTRNELLDNVWGSNFDGQLNTIDVYIRYLRNKIDKGNSNKLIQTIRGIGYELQDY